MNISKMNQTQLLKEIMQLEFAGVELNLLLDIHPDCQQVLRQFNEIHQDLVEHKEAYEKTYGPLCNFGHSPNHESYWQWIESPWPWEMKY